MELKKWMIVEHILFGVCKITDIDYWVVIFTSSKRSGVCKMEIDKFKPYMNFILDKNWEPTYSQY